MTSPITLSYVVTVYNKEPYIGHTIDSLLSQEGDFTREFIFVDDVSSDRSIAVIEEKTRGLPNVTLIRHSRNTGPSIGLNEGVRAARGEYVQFIDSDDIMAQGASAHMLALLRKHDADVIYGRWKKTGQPSAALLGTEVDRSAAVIVGNKPLEFIFTQRLLRMTQMVRRDTMLASGGCDERVFIQDESIVLRLGRVAKKFLLLDTPVVLVPEVEGELSRNRSQLNHDRFLAEYYFLADFLDLPAATKQILYRRCISCYWKQHRDTLDYPNAFLTRAFWWYVASRFGVASHTASTLQTIKTYFDKLPEIRRVPA